MDDGGASAGGSAAASGGGLGGVQAGVSDHHAATAAATTAATTAIETAEADSTGALLQKMESVTLDRVPGTQRPEGAGKPAHGKTVKNLSVSKLYGKKVPRTPMLDVLRTTISEARLSRIEDVLLTRCSSVRVLFENLYNPNNGAAAMRTAEGHGIQTVEAVEAFEPFRYSERINRQVDKWMTINRHANCLDAAEVLKADGWTLVGTCLDPTAQPLDHIDFGNMEKVVICFGNEERGLSSALKKRCHKLTYIPMVGMAESFNLSISVALVISHLKATKRIRADMTDQEIVTLYERWVVQSCKRAKQLISSHGFDYPTL